MSITIKTKQEIAILKEGGRRLAKILASVVKEAKPGVPTLDLNRLAESLIFASGGHPSFKGHQSRSEKKPFPAVLCTSVNDELVHGIPKQESILQEGDILGLDIGMEWSDSQNQKTESKSQKGLYTDMAVTIGIGKISDEAERLLRATSEALDIGMREVKTGARLGDVGHMIQKHLEKNKLAVIRDLAGHGVGYAVHEEPLIPNFGKPGTGLEIKEGMVFAIEPMATLGDWKIKLASDGWTFKTVDGSLAAHFEHTLAVTENGTEILTEL